MNHRQRAGFQQRPEILLEVDVLSGAERNGGRRRDAPVLVMPLPRHRVLHPGEVVFLQPPGQPDAILHRNVSEMVDRDRNLVSGHFAHIGHILVEIVQSLLGEMDAGESVRGVEEVVGLAAHRPRIDRTVRRGEDGLLVFAHLLQETERRGETPFLLHQEFDSEIHLEEGVSLFHPVDQCPAHVAPTAFGIGVAVNSHPVAEFPAQQLPDRDPPRLAGEVPQRNFNAADAPRLSGRPAELFDPTENLVDVAGILTENAALEHRGVGAAGGVTHLTVPDQSLIGVEFEQCTPLRRAVDVGKPHVGDFQCCWINLLAHGSS